MSFAKLFSAAVVGLDCYPVEVEVDLSRGLPGETIVGLPDKAVEESKERVRSAIINSSQEFPARRLTVNLAPADLKKQGPAYDLPIALGVLIADGQLPRGDLSDSLFVGELSLTGQLRHVNGVLPTALLAKTKEIRRLFVPAVNAAEAVLVSGLAIYPVNSLKELVKHLIGEQLINPYKNDQPIKMTPESIDYDFAYIKGQEQAKRALEIAAAGGHNVLMTGPPGSGKTLLARALPTILPQMSEAEILEVTKIFSVAGLLPRDQPLITIRPFRAPHHTASDIAMIGGGQWPRPGEISLAHRGVLFLDELPEFPRSVLEVLRQPLEDGVVTIARAAHSLTFPAQFMLVAAANPCPCGYLSDPAKNCVCSPSQVIRYQRKLSGPLIDRIDLHLEVPRVKFEKLTDEAVGEASQAIRKKVELARMRQRERFGGLRLLTNAEMRVKELKELCPLDGSVRQVLKQAVHQYHLTARAFHRIIKLARTIADLAESEQIEVSHVSEALMYRPKEASNL